jgi:lysophospholipase L1-like esterase
MTRALRRLLLLCAIGSLPGCGQSSNPSSGSGGGGGCCSSAGNGGAAGTAVANGGSPPATAGSGGASTGGAGTGGTGGAEPSGGAGTGGNAAAGSAGAPVDIDHSLPGKIVVLGSSTSAGTGPSNPDNAWVPRYEAYLTGQFPNVTLTNLAVGGQTTYHIQPTGYVPPGGRPAPVEGKNITAALALQPDAIIVNMPSNDQAGDIPQEEQQANYERIAALASTAMVKLWVSTSQPRNYAEPSRLTSLMQTRDFVLQRFAPRTLDFWTPFAKVDGTIAPEYDSGDGVHLNDAAHATLAEVVIAAKIPEAILAAK